MAKSRKITTNMTLSSSDDDCAVDGTRNVVMQGDIIKGLTLFVGTNMSGSKMVAIQHLDGSGDSNDEKRLL